MHRGRRGSRRAESRSRGYHPLSGGTLGPAFEDGMGVATVFGAACTQHYEEQVTRVSIEQSYIVNGVEFDGYDGGLLNTAQRQVKAVRATGTNTPIQWHIVEEETFNDLWNRQNKGQFPPEIELILTPQN